MSPTPVRRVFDRLSRDGVRRADLSVAAYRTAFDVERDLED